MWERRDWLRVSNHPFRLLRKSTKCLVWLRKHKPKHWETCEWTIHRFVHTARGHGHWLQSVWIATCQVVLKCLFLTRIGRLTWYCMVDGSQNGQKLFVKRFCRLISCIHHSCEFKQYCHVSTLSNNAVWDCFLTLFAGDLECSKSTSGGTLCVFGSHTLVPRSWMCEKQTSVSHSSTQSEIISLDAGLRLDGIHALDLLDLIFCLWSTTQNHDRTVKSVVCRDTNHVQGQSRGIFHVLNNVDFVPSNVQSSHQEVLWYVFEGKEAVIKMIRKSRRPPMRNVSRTHRVAVDWIWKSIEQHLRTVRRNKDFYSQKVTQRWMLTKNGLLKCGNLLKWVK